MSNSKFGFLPFLRKGLAKNITQKDDISISSSSNERTEITVDVKIDAPSGPQVVSKQVKLVGPGDILSVAKDVIVRTEPRNYIFDFESNLLPYIEFYEEDFLWRYSPAKETTDNKLRPWLALVVLKNNEYASKPPLKDGLPATIQLLADDTDVLHPNKEHWAWAHVQMNQPADSNPIQDLQQTIESNPDAAICRLLSSRQLEPNTEYTAFLIPAFETGRLAGLGEDPSGIKSLLGSWGYTAQGFSYTPALPQMYPVYHTWRFATSALGDFEALARKLKPIELSDVVGTRLMDARHLGMGLESLSAAVPNPMFPNDAAKKGTISLEGALYPAGSVYSAAENATPSSTPPSTPQDLFTAGLMDILNLQTTLQQAPNSVANVYNLGSNNEDPVILPPLYGQYHADQDKVDAASPLWFQEANLDLRYRAAAGMGAQVVKEKQELFMDIAWRQVGEVNAANEKIRKAQLAIQASKAIYEKHLVGKIAGTNVSNTTPDKFERILKIASPALKKVQTSSSGILSTVNNYLGLSGGSSLNNVALKTTAASTAVTNGTVNSGFRKMTRNRSSKIRVADKGSNALMQGLEKSLDASTAVKAASTFASPAGSQTEAQYMLNTVVVSNYGSVGSAMSIAAFPGSGTSLTNWMQYNKSQFDDFKNTYDYYKVLSAKDDPARQSIIVTNAAHAFRMAVQNSLDPEVSVAGRVMAQVKLAPPFIFNKVKQILAYPVIDLPMVNELVDLSIQNLVPNLGEIPNNSVTLLESNDRFIESFMLGLNYEFNRELMWREYPTDMRGTSFKVFWDKKDDLTGADIEDIAAIHQWPAGNALGMNCVNGSQNIMVLCIRGELFKKFPTAVSYAQKAKFGPSQTSPRELLHATDYSNVFDLNGLMTSQDIKTPIFRIDVQPDVVMLGFELTKEAAVGNPANFPNDNDAGWFFVFRERPGNTEFGLDAPVPVDPNNVPQLATSWDNLSWNHLALDGDATTVKTIIQDYTSNGLNATLQGAHWNRDAAQNAFILFQSPALVAIHADNMINE